MMYEGIVGVMSLRFRHVKRDLDVGDSAHSTCMPPAQNSLVH